ncbi:MAG: PCYCGC motif-containing lipoprotein [Candidatus Methanoperedens sp.]|nr:PCYCGC motif-containing lipoprotein [Candidatus Methanoperedens sp.]MCZ7403564.1 PCYCGC motif-containing lipoprotein [Candidatus Methanoperedens sp.]
MKPEKKGKTVKAKNEKIQKKKGNTTLIIGVVAVILIAGVAYALFSGGGSSTSTKTSANQIKFPSYVYTNPLTLKAYTYATEHPDMLEQIPCYCGCGGHSGHRFLRDCFVHDDWAYDEHASFCDVCVGEAIKVQDYLSQGKTLTEARALIDQEYGAKYPGQNTNTLPVRDGYIPILSPKTAGVPTAAPTQGGVDLSKLSLPSNFKSIADGLNLTPAGVNRAYFINTKMLTGTVMEAEYVGGSVQPDSFYGKKIIGMYSADFSASSWIEMHDLGYDSTKDVTLRAHAEPGYENIIYARPLIYGHTQNVDNVLKLIKEQNSMTTSYFTYKTLLSAVDYQNAAYALVITEPHKFSDINYMSMTPVSGKVELVKAFNITDNKSIPAGFKTYNPQMSGNILIIKETGDLTKIQADNDNIDAVAKT